MSIAVMERCGLKLPVEQPLQLSSGTFRGLKKQNTMAAMVMQAQGQALAGPPSHKRWLHVATAEPLVTGSKKQKLDPGTTKKVSFSGESVVEVERVTDVEKQQAWYCSEDYTQFVCRAYHEAQVLRAAAECATSAKELFHFIQDNPNLNPRGLEKILQYEACGNDQDEEDKQGEGGTAHNATARGGIAHHSKKIQLLRHRHRRVLLSMHCTIQKNSARSPKIAPNGLSKLRSNWGILTLMACCEGNKMDPANKTKLYLRRKVIDFSA
jgi:hypothetical protein